VTWAISRITVDLNASFFEGIAAAKSLLLNLDGFDIRVFAGSIVSDETGLTVAALKLQGPLRPG